MTTTLDDEALVKAALPPRRGLFVALALLAVLVVAGAGFLFMRDDEPTTRPPHPRRAARLVLAEPVRTEAPARVEAVELVPAPPPPVRRHAPVVKALPSVLEERL